MPAIPPPTTITAPTCPPGSSCIDTPALHPNLASVYPPRENYPKHLEDCSEGEQCSERSDAGNSIVPAAPARWLGAALRAHVIFTHLHPMRIVNQPVENAVGGGGGVDPLMPARHRQLRGQDRRASLVEPQPGARSG